MLHRHQLHTSRVQLAPEGVHALEERLELADPCPHVEQVRALGVERDPASGRVDGGGDVRLSGRPWTMGVAHPRQAGSLLGKLEVSQGAIVTSGDYYRYFEKDGVRYHHILDPRTGYSAPELASSTVTAPDGATADGLATLTMVLGASKGRELLEELPGCEGYFVSKDLEVTRTSGFALV